MHECTPTLRCTTVLASLFLGTTPAAADLIHSSPGLEGLGSYEGSYTYTPQSSQSATLAITLMNTSPADNGGFITAFAFQNPGAVVTGVSMSGTNANFGVIGDPTYQGGINTAPFPAMDIGGSTSSDFLGGGSPNGGIGVGQTDTFTFMFTGTGLDSLSGESFFTAPEPSGQERDPVGFLVRFRGFVDDGSDKVPGTTETVDTPEPTSVVMGLISLLGAAGYARHRRRRRKATV